RSASTCVFAASCPVNSQLHGPLHSGRQPLTGQAPHLQRRACSRSYGTILPSSFTRVLSSALEYSSQPPVSVSGTVSRNLKLRSFSWKHGINHFSGTKAQ